MPAGTSTGDGNYTIIHQMLLHGHNTTTCLMDCEALLSASPELSKAAAAANQAYEVAHFSCNDLCYLTLSPCPVYFGATTERIPGVSHWDKLQCSPWSDFSTCNWPLMHWVLLWFIAIFFDVGVIYYHITTVPHPKFLLRFWRSLAIKDHAISGVIEICMGLCALFSKDPYYFVWLQCIASFFFHIPSAAYQTPRVFGVRVVMVPAYALIVALKILCCVNLFMDKYSLQKLIMLATVHHIYVWCRVLMALFYQADIMRAHEYTVAILLAGFICVPCVLGPTGNFLCLLSIAMCALVIVPMLTAPKDMPDHKKPSYMFSYKVAKELKIESHREVTHSAEFQRTLDQVHEVGQLEYANLETPEQVATYVKDKAKGLFTAISASDTRGTPGTLELDELFGFLDSLQDSRSMKKKLASIRACLKDKGITDTNQEIPKETALPILESILQQQMQEKKLQSYYHLSPGNDITDEHDRNAAEVVAISKRPRLKRKERIERKRLKGLIVFELLNTNVDGKKELDESELGRLLELWGMPSNEAVDTITEVLVAAKNHKAKKGVVEEHVVSRAQFLDNFMPLIEFTFDDLLKNIQRQAQTKADNVTEAAFTQRKVLQELAELGTKQLPNLLKQLKEVDAEQFHDREVTGSPLVADWSPDNTRDAEQPW